MRAGCRAGWRRKAAADGASRETSLPDAGVLRSANILSFVSHTNIKCEGRPGKSQGQVEVKAARLEKRRVQSAMWSLANGSMAVVKLLAVIVLYQACSRGTHGAEPAGLQ